jgi:hypothetical protein
MRPNSDYELGLLGRASSLFFFFVAIAIASLGIALVVFLVSLIPATSAHIRIPNILVTIVLVPFIIPSFKLWRLGRRLRALTAAAVLRTDARSPILYLRSFQSDDQEDPRTVRQTIGGAWMQGTAEERDVQHLRRIGPVLAVSRPGVRLPPIGAARVAFSNADWKTGVRKLVNDSQLIVVKIGTSANLFWELGEVFQAHPFKRVLVCMPPSAADSITNTQQQYERFRRALAKELPSLAGVLPQELGATGYFLFRRPDSFIEFSGKSTKFPLELLEELRAGTLQELAKEKEKIAKFAAIAYGIPTVLALVTILIVLLIVIFKL